MSLDDLFGGAPKKRRGNKQEREEAVSVNGADDPFSDIPKRHRRYVERDTEDPFAGTNEGRLKRSSGAPGSSLDDLGGGGAGPRRRKSSSADKDFSSATAWGRFKGK